MSFISWWRADLWRRWRPWWDNRFNTSLLQKLRISSSRPGSSTPRMRKTIVIKEQKSSSRWEIRAIESLIESVNIIIMMLTKSYIWLMNSYFPKTWNSHNTLKYGAIIMLCYILWKWCGWNQRMGSKFVSSYSSGKQNVLGEKSFSFRVICA